MNPQDLARLENEAAEMVGAMKELFREFERHLGEIVSAQRMASSEARAEGARVTKDLHEIHQAARAIVSGHRELVARIEREWQLRIDNNAQRAGEAHAQAFGENIARGLQGRLEELADEVHSATRRLTWKFSLRWALGVAIAIPLTVAVCVSSLSPSVGSHVDKPPAISKPSAGLPSVVGLTTAQVREAVSRLSLCQVTKTNDWHACIEVDSPQRVGLGSADRLRVVVRGM